MRRKFNLSRLIPLVSAALLAAAAASGEIFPFEEKFDVEGALAPDDWLNTLSSTQMAVTTGNGEARLNNTANGYGMLLRTLPAPKPETFTITAVIKSFTPDGKDAGVLFCAQSNHTGYLLTYQNSGNRVFVTKVSQTSGGGLAWGDNVNENRYNTLIYEVSPTLKATDNEFVISKSGSKFNIFVNGTFFKTFTDNTHSSGDVALFVPGGTDALFGSIKMTDQFTDGEAAAWFSDDFSGGKESYWINPSSGSNAFAIADGVMKMTTPAGSNGLAVVDLERSDLEVRVTAKHIGGGTSDAYVYGIALVGPPSGGFLQIMYLGINAEKRSAVWSTNDDGYGLAPNGAINGPSGVNELKVVKSANANTYVFSVNGTVISNNYIVPFPVLRMGVFCRGGLTVDFDDFYAGPEGGVSVKWRTPTVRGKTVIQNASPFFYDLRGRRAYSVTPTLPNNGRTRTRAAGMYVNENGRDVFTTKGKKVR